MVKGKHLGVEVSQDGMLLHLVLQCVRCRFPYDDNGKLICWLLSQLKGCIRTIVLLISIAGLQQYCPRIMVLHRSAIGRESSMLDDEETGAHRWYKVSCVSRKDMAT